MKRPQAAQIWVLLLFLAAVFFAAISQNRQTQESEMPWPRATFNDGTPLGGRGLRRLCEWLGYPVRRVDGKLAQMPPDAAVWVLLDYKTHFSSAEMKLLRDWVQNGGTLLMAMPPSWQSWSAVQHDSLAATGHLATEWKLQRVPQDPYLGWTWEALPPLSPLTPGAAADYWTGVKQASASNGSMQVKSTCLEIAGTVQGAQLVRLDMGRGRVFVAADALLFSNYALDAPDTAVLVTNLLRSHIQAGPQAAIYFDERQHGDTGSVNVGKKSWAYYVWRPPLRYAVMQILLAGLLLWMLYGRRLGTPVPLPDNDPVTRASHFACAMGALLHKSQRPQVAAQILGDEFRRTLAHKLGLSVQDPDNLLAERAAQVADLPPEHVMRLLRVAKSLDANEETLLNEVQQMSNVIRRLSR